MRILPGVIGTAAPADYPLEANVELDISFAHGTKTGTLVTTGEDIIIEISTEQVDID